MRDQPVSRIMTTPAIVIAPEAPLRDAADLMTDNGLHHLPVVREGRLVGILSATDLLRAGRGHEAPSPRTVSRVADLMRSPAVTLEQDATLGRAARLLADGGYHALPVVDPAGSVLGIVTSTDLIIVLLRQLPAGQTPAPGTDIAGSPDDRAADLEAVCRAAELYLRSGHGEHEHAVLIRALARAREHLDPRVPAGRL
ncbi:MAG: CBS domain-containing protein [Gammaproteobacteria bacterium]|nr:CBS domain-containing protein [Gammaproteobacteria bacterium]